MEKKSKSPLKIFSGGPCALLGLGKQYFEFKIIYCVDGNIPILQKSAVRKIAQADCVSV